MLGGPLRAELALKQQSVLEPSPSSSQLALPSSDTSVAPTSMQACHRVCGTYCIWAPEKVQRL